MLNTTEAGPQVVGAKAIFMVQLEYTGNPEDLRIAWSSVGSQDSNSPATDAAVNLPRSDRCW